MSFLESSFLYSARLTKQATLVPWQARLRFVLNIMEMDGSNTPAHWATVCHLGISNSTGTPIFSDFNWIFARRSFSDRWSRGTKTLGTWLEVNQNFNIARRLGYKWNTTKYRSLSGKPRSHVRIMICRTWPITSLQEISFSPCYQL